MFNERRFCAIPYAAIFLAQSASILRFAHTALRHRNDLLHDGYRYAQRTADMATAPPHKSPPYASYVSFQNYLDHLRGKALPSRIDNSVMAHLNYGTRQALMAALRALGLVGEGDTPTTALELLVDASDEDRQELLLEAIKSTYPYFFDGRIDLARATTGEFQSVFREATGAQGSTIDKASSFFFGLAAAAGVSLSPHLVTRKAGGGGARRAKPRPKKQKANVAEDLEAAEDKAKALPKVGIASQLLDKFPTFDPAWPDEIKTKWFSGFERLMESADKTGQI